MVDYSTTAQKDGDGLQHTIQLFIFVTSYFMKYI
nr:MAG TPA: hypothetical protein [Caudoviricetes sp.]DAV22579.1 MAG TPA: hypothetical protein [Caudoviricetes sp.]